MTAIKHSHSNFTGLFLRIQLRRSTKEEIQWLCAISTAMSTGWISDMFQRFGWKREEGNEREAKEERIRMKKKEVW